MGQLLFLQLQLNCNYINELELEFFLLNYRGFGIMLFYRFRFRAGRQIKVFGYMDHGPR